jgi:hypothetical protein
MSSSASDKKASAAKIPTLFRLACGEANAKEGMRVVAIQSKKDRDNKVPETVVGTIVHLGTPLPDDAPDLDDFKQDDLVKSIRELREGKPFDISSMKPTGPSTRCHFMFVWKKNSGILRRVGGATAGTVIGRPFGKELATLLACMNRNDDGELIHPNDEGIFAKAGLDPLTQTTADYDASKVPVPKKKKKAKAKASEEEEEEDERPAKKAKKSNDDDESEEKPKKAKKAEGKDAKESDGDEPMAEESKKKKKTKLVESIPKIQEAYVPASCVSLICLTDSGLWWNCATNGWNNARWSIR